MHVRAHCLAETAPRTRERRARPAESHKIRPEGRLRMEELGNDEEHEVLEEAVLTRLSVVCVPVRWYVRRSASLFACY